MNKIVKIVEIFETVLGGIDSPNHDIISEALKKKLMIDTIN